MRETYLLIAVLILEGDKLWWRLLHEGSLDECEREQKRCDAITWAGPEKAIEAFSKVMKREDWQAALAMSKEAKGTYREWTDQEAEAAPMQVRMNP